MSARYWTPCAVLNDGNMICLLNGDSLLSKYQPLADFLHSYQGDSVQLTFQQLEQIIGDSLPPSSQTWSWWINSDIPSRPQAGQWLAAGWRRGTLQLSNQIVTFERTTVRYWWVNHKQTYRSEIEGGYVWSPKANSNGARNQTYLNLTLVRPGDIVFSYAGAEIRAIGVVTAEHQEQRKPEEFGLTGDHWSAEGWLVPIEWVVLDIPISPKAHLTAIAPLLPTKNSPLQGNGNGNQSCYLASVSVGLGLLVLKLARQGSPFSVDRLQELEDRSIENSLQTAIERDQNLSPTEREQLTRARVGQGLFRQRVQSIEKGCRLTGITDTRFLVASHIKPWKSGDNSERLDGHNGLLLAPHVDKLFDRGWMTFEDNGDVLVEKSARTVISSWGLSGVTNVGAFTKEQQKFLRYHRAEVFKGQPA